MQNSPLNKTLDDAAFYSLSLVRVGDEWQANLQVERGGGWRVCHGATPSEAIAALFAVSAVPVPPPPPY